MLRFGQAEAGRYDNHQTRKKNAEMRREQEEEKWKRKRELDQALEEFHEPTEEELIVEARKRRRWEQQLEYERHLMELNIKEMRLQKERDDTQDMKWAEIRNKKFEKEQQYGVGEYQIGHDKEKWALATLDMNENETYDQETVIKKYNELAVKYNPATNPDDEISKAIFGWVNEAYKFLSEKSNQREFSITTPSYFNFSSPPLGFQKNKYFVNVRP
jgi:hypothetical protein